MADKAQDMMRQLLKSTRKQVKSARQNNLYLVLVAALCIFIAYKYCQCENPLAGLNLNLKGKLCGKKAEEESA